MFADHSCILLLPIVEGLFYDAEFTTDVVNRSAAFFFIEGFYFLTLGVSALFYLNGETSGFLLNFIRSEF